MEDWAKAGYPNAASARHAERIRIQKEKEADLRKRKGELAADARKRLQPAGSSIRNFNVPPSMK
jgi:hypothetical protein